MNFEVIFPSEGVTPVANNFFLAETFDVNNAFIKVDNDIVDIELKPIAEITPGIWYADIDNCKELLESKNIKDIIEFANKYPIKDSFVPTSFDFSYSKRDLSSLMYSKEEMEIEIEIKDDCLLFVNNVLIDKNTTFVLPANKLIPVRMIFHSGRISFNIDKNIFFLPKEKNE